MIPLVSIIFTGEWAFIVYTFIPGIDEQTMVGRIVNTSYHILVCIMTYIGNSGCDLLLMILVLNLWPISRVFQCAVEDLNRTLESVTISDRVKKAMAKKQLRNILLMHKDIYW